MVALSVTAITVDERCQPRVAVDPRVVDDYADEMVDGVVFPPLTVYHDGSTYWLADGFHRLSAAMKLGLAEVECDVRNGSMRDAILASCQANMSHGLRRTNADKQRAVRMLVLDDEWSLKSDGWIADRCGVHGEMVSTIRNQLAQDGVIELPEMVEYQRNGKTFTKKVDRAARSRAGKASAKARQKSESNLSDEPEIEPDRDDWWDDNPTEPPAPPPTQTHSSTWMQPPPKRTWEQDDAKAFAALLALQDASSREPRFVAAAAVETNPVGARLMMQRAAELIIWHREFLEALKEQLS